MCYFYWDGWKFCNAQPLFNIMSNRLRRMEQKIERLESNNWHNNMGEMLVCRKYENQSINQIYKIMNLY